MTFLICISFSSLSLSLFLFLSLSHTLSLTHSLFYYPAKRRSLASFIICKRICLSKASSESDILSFFGKDDRPLVCFGSDRLFGEREEEGRAEREEERECDVDFKEGEEEEEIGEEEGEEREEEREEEGTEWVYLCGKAERSWPSLLKHWMQSHGRSGFCLRTSKNGILKWMSNYILSTLPLHISSRLSFFPSLNLLAHISSNSHFE